MLVKLPLCVIFLFFSVIIVATIHTEWQDADNVHRTTSEPTTYRLNNLTEPLFYELWFETQIQRGILDYSGRVIITLRVLEPTRFITIHSLVKILQYGIKNEDGQFVPITNIEFNLNSEICTFVLRQDIVPEKNYTLEIQFTETFNDQSRGFFYRRYLEDSKVLYMATTYLHSGNARFAFPCYDEPKYRAPFIIHVTHDPSLEAISNMPVEYIVNNTDGTITTSFYKTPPTPVNIISITITQYASRTQLAPRNIPLSVYAPKDFIHEVDFALDFSIPVISRIEEYMDYEYTLPKLDYLSILDFIPGAMENWGTFLFDSQYMLYKNDSTTERQKMTMARIMTHELVHNYFGSLVGVKWWSDMWMMEAFANFGEFYFTDVFLPGYHFKEVYVTEVMHRSLIDHGFIGTRPIASYIEEPREVRRILEGYLSKAALTMRMLFYAFGEEVFQKCVRHIVHSMALSTITPEEMYEIFERVIEENEEIPDDVKVSEILRTWFEQPGYPLLNIRRDYEANTVIVTQQRFLSARNESVTTNSSWFIPLSLSTSREPNMEDTTPYAWMKPGVEELVLKPNLMVSWGEDDWVLFNIQQTGYFRINYDTQNWILLAKELHQGYPFRIPPLNRAQLIDDSFNLAYSDVIDFTVALDIIKYVIKEDQYTVWTAANRHLLSLNRRLDGPSYEKYFGRFLQHITEEHLDKLDVFENINPNETISATFLRPIVVDLACRAGSGKCLTATRVLVMAESMTGHRLVPREVSSAYYCHGLKNANLETFKYFWNKLHNLTHEQERSHFSNSLTCYHDEEVVMEILLTTSSPLSNYTYSNLERLALLATAFRNGHIRSAINFFQEHHEDIAVAYGFSMSLDGLLREMTSYLHLADDIKAFLAMLDTLIMHNYISDEQKSRIIDEMEHNFEWVEENKAEIESWIQNYFEPGSVNTAGNKFISIWMIFIVICVKIIIP